MSKSSINIILVIAGCIFLYYLANQLVSEKKVPAFSDYLASSTEAVSSSTDIVSSSTESLASTTGVVLSQVSSTTLSTKNISTSSIAFFNLLKLPSTTIFAPKGSLKVFIANTVRSVLFSSNTKCM